MDNFAKKLASRAKEIAKQIQSGANSLKQTRSELERQILAIDAELQKLELAPLRAEQFQPVVQNHYQCPACGASDGSQTALLQDGPDEDDNDVFRCKQCGFKNLTRLEGRAAA